MMIFCFCISSPAIVDESCNFDAIANRIAWAKLANAGQVCHCFKLPYLFSSKEHLNPYKIPVTSIKIIQFNNIDTRLR